MSIKYKINSTIEWLQEQVKNAGCQGLIVGISGGIDSALCAFLIKKAFPNNSLGLIMPCDSNVQDKIDGLLAIEKCKLEYMEIDLTSIYQQMVAEIKKGLNEKNFEDLNLTTSQANLKARLRMSTLYSIANALNYLVVGTDNQAELYTGYFTKYGDGGVDILPLAQLTKREVRAWARELGVPAEIITKVPSAGLWENQTDEEEIGVTYDIIDDYLEGKEIPQRDKEIIERLHKISAHKRSMPLMAPKFN
ncbi:MAG: NAD(+) synthase [Clostridia bacterium]|nr:NAD(+) synthase [Clostridia bacterium]